MSLIKRIYDSYLRTHLSKKIGVYNGVAIRRPRLYDKTDERAQIKTGFVRAVRETVTTGDTVVEIGTGGGIGTVWAARQSVTGPVYTYDGAVSKVEKFQETARLNQVSDAVTANAAIVRGDDSDTADTVGGTHDGNLSDNVVSITNLPRADVYLLDCEGAEINLVPKINRGNVVVETHGHKGAATDKITAELQSSGFSIDDMYNAEPDTSVDNKVVIATHE